MTCTSENKTLGNRAMGGMSGHEMVEVMGYWKNCIIKKFVQYITLLG